LNIILLIYKYLIVFLGTIIGLIVLIVTEFVMKTYFIFLFYFLICAEVFAQKTKDFYKVKSGTDISKMLPFEERYQFGKFQEGKVYFRNGKIVTANLNYSIVHGEVQFVNFKKDTLLLTDHDFIDRIAINDHVFYYLEGHGHIQQKADFSKIKLAEKQFLVVMGREKYAAYDQYSATSAISSYSGYTSGTAGAFSPLQGIDKVILRKRFSYFWIDKNQRISNANKANLLKIFPKYKHELNEFVKDNNTDFNKEDDLIKILEYTDSL